MDGASLPKVVWYMSEMTRERIESGVESGGAGAARCGGEDFMLACFFLAEVLVNEDLFAGVLQLLRLLSMNSMLPGAEKRRGRRGLLRAKAGVFSLIMLALLRGGEDDFLPFFAPSSATVVAPPSILEDFLAPRARLR